MTDIIPSEIQIFEDHAKCMFHMQHLFANGELLEMLDKCEAMRVFNDITTLEDCQAAIKPTTFMIGHIKRTNQDYTEQLDGYSFLDFLQE